MDASQAYVALTSLASSSANAFADDIINSRISGMNLHLSNPLDEEKIVSAIKECIVSRKIEIPSV